MARQDNDHRNCYVGGGSSSKTLASAAAAVMAARSNAGRSAAVSQGRVMRAGFGYRRLEGSAGGWVVDVEAAELVRRVFQRLDAGAGPAEVARELSGLDPRWTARRVVATASNPVFAGLLVWGRIRSRRDPYTGARTVVAVPREEWVTASRPDLAIVDAALFARVGALLSAKGRRK